MTQAKKTACWWNIRAGEIYFISFSYETRMCALYEPLFFQSTNERDWRKMQLLPWFLTWYVWRAMGTITTQRFLAPQQKNMKITSPSLEFVAVSELQCAPACQQ